MPATESGNNNPVTERVWSFIDELGGDKWIVEGYGTSIHALEILRSRPALVGHQYLILLSQFLQRGSDHDRELRIGASADVAERLKWSNRDTQMLRIGMATTHLLKPDRVEDALERPRSKDDPGWQDPLNYWWWVRPQNAFVTGWWDTEAVEDLKTKLSRLRPRRPVRRPRL